MTPGRIRLGGLGLLLGSLLVYVLAVDRTWYAVDGMVRLAVETYGLPRWSFLSHALGLSNGAMLGQSWAFVAFPVMFWTAVVLVLVGSVLVRRAGRRDTPPQRALNRLRGRRVSTLAARRRWFEIMASMLGIAATLAIAGVVTLRSAPSSETLVNAQTAAGNWRGRLDEMRDDQRLMIAVRSFGGLRFGALVSPSEASALVRRDTMERERADADARLRCGAARDPGECLLLHTGAAAVMERLLALTRSEVATSTAAADREWRAALASLDLCAIVGLALSVAFVVLLMIVWVFAPRVIAVELRGFDPAVEDPLYARYTPLGQAMVFVALLVATIGIACTDGSLPDGISVGIIACMATGACGLLGIGRVLLAPRVLARARNPQLAANVAVERHDHAVQAGLVKLEIDLSAKQQYLATLRAASSPLDLVAAAHVEVQQLEGAVARQRTSKLGNALREARRRMHAAATRLRALRGQSAPPEAFGAVDAALQAARAEIALLANAAGWVPWPLSASESVQAAPRHREGVSLAIGGVACAAVVASVVAFSRPRDMRAAHAEARVPARDARCDSILDDYQRALSAASDTSGMLPNAGCATDERGTLVPSAQLKPSCRELWERHLTNARRAMELNGQARAACPSLDIPLMGALSPTSQIDPKSVSRRDGSLSILGSAAPPSGSAAGSPALTLDGVSDLVKSQARSLTGDTAAFGDSFATDAAAFFPHSLTLYAGRDRIIGAAREAWGMRGAPDHLESSDVVVGLFPNFAWATAQWKRTLANTKTVALVRVTEVVVQDATGLRVIAASFSMPPPAASSGIGEPVPVIVAGAPPAREPDSWLASPIELARHVRNDGATVVIGSEAKELALGTDETRELLGRWWNVRLELAGNVRAIEGPGYRIVAGYARWLGTKPVLFRVLGLFVPGDAMAGPAPWEFATVHYSVAVPSDATVPSKQGTAGVDIRAMDLGR